MKDNYRTTWILHDTLGIFFGIAIAAALLFLTGQWLGQPMTAAGKAGNLGVALIGGLIAGSVLAWFQYNALKKRYDDLRWITWWGNTVIAFIAGWIIAILPSLSYTGENTIQQVIPPFGIPLFTIMYISIFLGGVVGALIGAAQWLELRKYREKAYPWIGLNAFSWALGVFVIALAGMVFQTTGGLSLFLLTGVGGAIVAAVAIAGITSMFFRKANREASA